MENADSGTGMVEVSIVVRELLDGFFVIFEGRNRALELFTVLSKGARAFSAVWLRMGLGSKSTLCQPVDWSLIHEISPDSSLALLYLDRSGV